MKIAKHLFHTSSCTLFFLLAALNAQTPTGQITGRITDASGAVVPGGEVAVANVETGMERRTVSNQEGYYAVSLLPPGQYRVTVRRDGFRPFTRTGITLTVDQVLRLDFALELGTVSEAIEVTAAAPTVEAGTAALGTVVASKQIRDMPLNSRNPLRLAYLVPGFVPTRSFSDQFNRASSFRVNGGRSNMNDLFVDGVSNSPPASNGFLSYAGFPSPDALQEFKVQTNSYGAEYGRSNGGVVNMVLRSGTNQFHGVVYEFLRNSKMDANNFFANRANVPLPSFKRNQFGFAGGGPIVRDKAFFFVNYEGLRQRQAANFTGTMPTALERSGDFSQTNRRVAGACRPAQIYDPVSTRANPAGGFIRDPFPGNAIPAGRLDPVALKISEYYPNPNQPGDPCTGVNNFFNTASNKFDANQLDAKVDWNLSDKDRLVGGLSWRRSLATSPNHYNNIAYTAFQVGGFEIPSWNTRLDYTRVQTPTLLLNFRVGFSRVLQDAPPPVGDNFDYATIGLPTALQRQSVPPAGFPVFNVAGYSTLGQVFSSPLEIFQTYSLAGSATVIRGKHTIKFGLDQRLNQVGSNLKENTNGNYTFNAAFTQGPNPNVAAANLGNGMASFLLGTGASGFVRILPSVFTSNIYTALYVQDDFKVTSRLTLNLGLRYDVENGKYDRFNQLTWFDYNVESPLAAQVGMPLRGGVRFQGVDAGAQYPTDWNNFGPRFGLAYNVSPKTVVRTGYGLFFPPYVGMAGNARGSEGFSTQTPWVTSIDGLTPEHYLRNPFPNGLDLPTGNRLGLLTNVGQNHIDSIDREVIRSSYAQQWNVNLQRELPGRVAVEVAYVGNKGTKLTDLGWEMNQLRADQLQLGAALQQRVDNPFFGLITSGPLSTRQVTRGQLMRPFPQYLSVINFRPTSASSSYHALQLRVQREFADGSSFLLSYTNGKLIDDSVGVGAGGGGNSEHMDAYNRRLSRAVSTQDISQRLVVSYIQELPFGRNRNLGRDWPRWLDLAIGQWQVNGILTLATGQPLAITAANNSNAFSRVQRANIIGDAKLSGDRSTDDRLREWFNTGAFAQPAPFTFGNSPRTLPNVRTPGERNLDFSLFKGFPFDDQRRLEFRAEFFNLTNTPNFGAPGQVFGSAAFGQISAQANDPRQVQLGLKFYF